MGGRRRASRCQSLLFPGHDPAAGRLYVQCMNHDAPRFRLWTDATVQKATRCMARLTLATAQSRYLPSHPVLGSMDCGLRG